MKYPFEDELNEPYEVKVLRTQRAVIDALWPVYQQAADSRLGEDITP
jgi:hypothetical protein